MRRIKTELVWCQHDLSPVFVAEWARLTDLFNAQHEDTHDH
jgi:hypothetical protein